MKPAPFTYIRPDSVESAITALAENAGARPLAGGQSLVPMLHMRLMQPAALVDLNRVAGLAGIVVDGDGLTVGALTRYSELESSPLVAERLPLLQHAVRFVGDRQVRNRGTLGGSLAQADPVGEMPLVCLALGAVVCAQSREGVREIPLDDFLLGPYTTTLEPDELIVAVRFPEAPAAYGFFEVSRRHNDFAVLAVAVTGTRGADGAWQELRLALAGVDDRPVLVPEAVRRLEGTTLDAGSIDAAVQACLAVIDPPSDVRASEEYRRHLAGVHVERVLRRLRDEEAALRG
ncbi:Aerobic-type carbon monoxide dehydrogenase middle subunit CoxM/CutM-like [Gaiella occulta]|uniref:Aerobic-type carbon monoxide dehydrogenase middle subunit CoxM/CutM-like n=1 Tax=Gaiella occulta TaxID=1002870 RepID=A0A7M2YZ20_9ACTN|nr:xanthine dehydrogenase family protein subunit M [Gaiella occulta]RDI74749.1 Aerobic-type carbon monoxide dehydrogenase middle subunit CoxM/CutM-like [Gaiella occulta]